MVCYVYVEIQFDWSFYPRVLSFSTNRITAKFWQSGKICQFVKEMKTRWRKFTISQFHKTPNLPKTYLSVLLFITLFLMTQTHSFFVLFYKNFFDETHQAHSTKAHVAPHNSTFTLKIIT